MKKEKNKAKNKKVLIIDDEDVLRDILVEVMEINDIESYSASRGYEGVEIYKKFQNDIGLVLLDLLMPGETGIETYENLSHINPDVNVIFMSGIGDKDSLQNISNFDSCAFIKKPFSLNEITEKVSQCMKAKYAKPVPGLQHN